MLLKESLNVATLNNKQGVSIYDDEQADRAL
jgi:hypothetical protein